MTHMARRIWGGEAGCGFCLRAEPGGVWCRGLCWNIPLMELVKRVGAIRDNSVRLEVAQKAPVKPVKPHVVPCAPANRCERATLHRSTTVERMVGSMERLRRSAAVTE